MTRSVEELRFKQFRRKQIAELADWYPGFDMTGVSVSDADKSAGSPKTGDKIARNPANHADRWLVAADYFAVNFEPAIATEAGEKEKVNDVPLCGGCAQAWFTERNHLRGDHDCVVCAFLAIRKSLPTPHGERGR